ncbi:MAG: CPBP family intramembrane metalloprotease [candidate division Zixibacteria bacterium]|nr:CPBP family intramembrane metalloprotease [candidate division Zixibacteria bacterium]
MRSETNENHNKIKTILILIYVPVVLTIFIYYGSANFYNNLTGMPNLADGRYYYFLSSFILLGLIPALIWFLGFKQKLSGLGLGIGNLKRSLVFTAIGLPVMAILAYFSSNDPAFQMEYPLFRGLIIDQGNIISYILMYGLYYVGWEVFFRGFMLFGLKDKFGDTYSILIQTIPSCLVHIGKPDAEIFSSIIAGIAFGWIVLRCRSIWPIFICHWALGVFLDLFIIYG